MGRSWVLKGAELLGKAASGVIWEESRWGTRAKDIRKMGVNLAAHSAPKIRLKNKPQKSAVNFKQALFTKHQLMIEKVWIME